MSTFAEIAAAARTSRIGHVGVGADALGLVAELAELMEKHTHLCSENGYPTSPPEVRGR